MGKKYAILSVYDKTGIIDFAKKLKELDFEIISSGGTAKLLKENDVEVTLVSNLTGFPEIFDGRVKTLHPLIHGGILARRNNVEDLEIMKKLNIPSIEVVVVNLYPFEKTINKKDVSFDEVIENIDIGGPTLIRAAAKNFKDVLVVVDPDDYNNAIELLKNGKNENKFLEFAIKAFCHTAYYDGVISTYLLKKVNNPFAEKFAIPVEKKMQLRYGENPHQKACLYIDKSEKKYLLSDDKQFWGKQLSYNNLLDADATIKLCLSFDEPAVVITKHNNPCGVAIGKNIAEAYEKALSCDPISAFGSIICVNRKINKEAAQLMSKLYIEVLIAPSFSDEAKEILQKKKNIRLILLDDIENFGNDIEWRKVSGGFLVQESDKSMVKLEDLKIVTKVKPTEDDLKGLLFAWKVVKFVKSNAIVFTNKTQTLGIGAGQMSRVDSVKFAISKSNFDLNGSYLASDAFFPFRDGIDEAARVGVKAVIQPGGSIRDEEVIKACDEHGIAMVFTGMRHFRH